MSISLRKALAVAGVLSISVLAPVSGALAQATPAQSGTPSRVLPTGGGAALLDPSDTVFLLLDHQAGLFQTVKDIGVAVLSEVHRTWNRPEAREIGNLYAHVSPNYAAVVESYLKAQEVAKQAR